MEPCNNTREPPKCKNCVTFLEPTVQINSRELEPIETVTHSTYTRDYPGHKRISPPLVRRPKDALPIATDYKNKYITTCQERFRPWDMKIIPRYENNAPRRQYVGPEVCSSFWLTTNHKSVCFKYYMYI